MKNLKFVPRLIIFSVINFSALGLGAWLMEEGPTSEWYRSANQAPWTPPGWVFGAAWFTIMACFSFYMASLTKKSSSKIISVFIVLTLLNVSWNPLFFHYHLIAESLGVICLLTILVIITFFTFYKELKSVSFLILPYALWLIIATSLNAYFLFNNP